MAQIRAHVAAYGITGHRCAVPPGRQAICPRALVAWASGEGPGMIFQRPRGRAARRVMDALECEAVRRYPSRYGSRAPSGTGRVAEAYAHAADTPEALAWIDAAAARL